MEQKKNPKIERVLALVEPGRRDALRKILATAAYAAPVVASFSLDAAAAPVSGPVSCLAANQTCLGVVTFSGTVKCKGLSLDQASVDLVPQPVNLKFDVQVTLCEGATGGVGNILGGPVTLVDPDPVRGVTYTQATFEGKNNDTLGFAVTDCPVLGYYETGQWTHKVEKNGKETLKGKSWVMVTPATFVGTAYTLECEYDLDNIPPV